MVGNIKFDVNLDAEIVQSGKSWRAGVRNRNVLLCASTREDEEPLLLAAYTRVFNAAERIDTLLVIVPRHPHRFDQVANDIGRAGLRFSKRSQMILGAAREWPEVLLGDSMGEMAAYYAFCDVAIIGGSFVPLGGQNLIEACALGRPVIMGSSTFNFNDVARLAVEGGAMLPALDAFDAMRIAHRLLLDGEARKSMSSAGLELVATNRGATTRMLALINAALRKS